MIGTGDDFRQFVAERFGCEPPSRIEPGRFFRFPTNGRRDDDAGYAKLFPDAQGGIAGDFRTGAYHVWQAKRERPFSESERRALQERIERERREAEALREREEREAAQRARAIWNQGQPAPENHPYLVAKCIRPHGLRLYRGPLAVAGMRCDGALIVPVRSPAGELQTVEFIAPNGEKRFLPGGRKSGGYFAVGKPDGVLCIAEGYATGASVYEASGHAVAVAFDAGNLLSVAKAMRDKLPGARIIVTGDNDESGTGQRSAEAAARAVGGFVAIPPETGKDWNDIHREHGSEVVQRAIASARAPAEVKAQATTPDAPTGAKSAGEWPEPSPLPEGLPAVAQFDFALLPETLRPWAEDICERVQCPPDYLAAAIMAALGAVIGRKVGIRPQEQTDWTEFPNQWALAVGRPGVLKSPALEQALAPLKRLAGQAVESHRAAIAEYEQAARVAKLRAEAGEKAARAKLASNREADISGDLASDQEEAPTLRRYIANDSTAAALGELLRQNPNGVLVHRDELVSLLKGLDREDNAEARGFYLTGWNGNSAYTFDRIGRGMNLHIQAVCLSLLGSTQPGRIAEYLRAAVKGGAGDDGLIQRFGLLVWPDVGGDWRDVDRWPDGEARRKANAIFEALDRLNPGAVGAANDKLDGVAFLRFDAGGLELFRDWRQGWEAKLRAGELHPALESHLAKYRKLVPSLALVLHLAAEGTGPVSKRATLQALAWAEYLESHARRAYASVTSPEVAAARAILEKLRRAELPRRFAARDVYRHGWAHLSDRQQVLEALQLLADLDWLAVYTQDTDGRTATVYEANPRGLER